MGTAKSRLGLSAALALALGCSSGSLSDMVPGGHPGSGQLECWLTLTFKRYPDGIDPRAVKVRFTSIALAGESSFDWDYIAARDVIPQGFGRGFKPNEASQPAQIPPLDTPIRLKFPLRAKPHVEVGRRDHAQGRAVLGRPEAGRALAQHRARLHPDVARPRSGRAARRGPGERASAARVDQEPREDRRVIGERQAVALEL